MTFDFLTVINNIALPLILKLAPFWVPLVLGFIAWRYWMSYINHSHIAEIKWTLLQITVPKEVQKSPQAMELFMGALYQTGGHKDWYKTYVLGKLRSWFSLELVSIEGKIFFFIRTPSFFKNIIEAQIYAQYPQAEIAEVADYTNDLVNLTKKGDWSMFGTEFVLTKADPYPIKTYIDYGMDKAGSLEEEQRIDPITPLMEFLGQIKDGEQIWIQILVRASLDEKKWQKEADDEVKKILEKAAFKPKEAGSASGMHLSEGQKTVAAALERSVSKLGFDCGIRAIYLAEKNKFNPSNIPGLLGSMRQYNSNNLNGFRPKNVTAFDFPWQDIGGRRSTKLKHELFDAYRTRSYFYMPHDENLVAGRFIKRPPFILNAEELATIYHFPGRVSETPTFKRLESKKSEPPGNLPV